MQNNFDALVMPSGLMKRSFNIDTMRVTAKEVCDVIMMQCNERFNFTKHLEASNLLCVDNFPSYVKKFPKPYLDAATVAYPSLDKNALQNELFVLYSREDLVDKKDSIITLLEKLVDNNLQSVFPNTVKLIKILITTPMISAEAERCFSTLKRIKSFLRATMLNERLSALAMISIENKLISEITEFNEKVITYFANKKDRRAEFIFK